MVGWNVAATQLVAGRVLYKISNLVYFTSAIIITVNEYNEHVAFLIECMFASAMYMKDYASQYVLCFKNFISALYACSCSWGYFSRMFGDSSILFIGLRVGDVTTFLRMYGHLK